MKSLAILFGIVGAGGSHPCLWCHCNLRTAVEIDNICLFERTQELSRINFTNKTLGYTNKPIIDFVEYDDVVFDMLHMHLRITDKLFECLMSKLIEFDHNEAIDMGQRVCVQIFNSFLVSDCNITKPIIFDENDSRKTSLRTLNNKERHRIFQKLFDDSKKGFIDLFANCKILEEHDFNIEVFVWREFMSIFKMIKEMDHNESEMNTLNIENLKSRLKVWLHFYKRLDPMTNTSPYVHIFVFHVPEFLNRHGSINLFNCEGLEKLNDIITQFYHNSTNKHKSNNDYIIQLIKKLNRTELFNIEDNLLFLEEKII